MPKRVLVVAEDTQEWQAMVGELGARLDVLRANGRDQALTLVEKTPDLAAVVCHWGPLSSGPDLMRRVQQLRPALVRALITASPATAEAKELLDSGVVRLMIGKPWPKDSLAAAVARAVGADAIPLTLRAEPRAIVKVQLHVSTSAWEGFAPLWTRDVSRGGAFFCYAAQIAPNSGSRCVVKYGLALAEAQVAHVVTPRIAAASGSEAGFGISFIARQQADWWLTSLPPATKAAAPASVVVPVTPRPTPPTPRELETAKNFFSLGTSLLEEKNYGAARQKFELAARIVPDGPEAMPVLCNGLQFARLGVLDKAKEALERALLLDPACAPARKALDEIKRR